MTIKKKTSKKKAANKKSKSFEESLELELGSNEASKESGLYLISNSTKIEYQTALSNYQGTKGTLDKQLNTKATDRKTGIKYKPEQFGDQNYTIRKLDSDIKAVLKDDFRV